MLLRYLKGLAGPALLTVLSLYPGLSLPADATESQVIDGVQIYLGVLPAAMVRGHPKDHPESSMHDGIPSDSDAYHVLITLFDSKSGQRITGAEVRATVVEPGLAGEEKRLEPMTIAETVTYGNYFRMSGPGPFSIRIAIRIPGAQRAIQVRFLHRHN